jgi:gas vesicle protein
MQERKEDGMSNSSGSTGFGIGMLVGAIAGLIIGLLYAPRPGEESRELVRQKASEVRDKGLEFAERARDVATEAREKAREAQEKGAAYAGRARDAVSEAGKKVKAKLEEA